MELEVGMGMGWRTGCSGDLWAVGRHSWGAAGDGQQECPTRMSSEMWQQGAGTEGRSGFCPWENSKPMVGALATRRAHKCFLSVLGHPSLMREERRYQWLTMEYSAQGECVSP